MPLFGKRETPEEERARLAHEAIDSADADTAAALAHSEEARQHALQVAAEEARDAETHVEQVTSREHERLLATSAAADDEAARTIDKAQAKAGERKQDAERRAAEAISRAEQEAEERRQGALSRAVELRNHASAEGGGGSASAAVPAGWYDDPDGQGAQRWWDGTRWTERTNG